MQVLQQQVQQRQGQVQPQQQTTYRMGRDLPPRARRQPDRLSYGKKGEPDAQAGSVCEAEDMETEFCFEVAVTEPTTLAEVLGGPDGEKWKESVQEEYNSLIENGTWELTDLPPGKKAITTRSASQSAGARTACASAASAQCSSTPEGG